MKQIPLLLTCIIFLSFTDKPAEPKKSAPPIPIAGVYLYSNNITTNAGNAAEGHPDEVALANDSMNVILPFTGTPPQNGAPQFGDVFIKKAFDITSLRLMNLIANPNTKTFEIRYYNGVSTTPVYKVVLLNSFIRGSSDHPGAPSRSPLPTPAAPREARPRETVRPRPHRRRCH